MASKTKISKQVDNIMEIFRIHYEQFNEMPIQEGYKFIFKIGFVFEWLKVNQQELTEIIKRLKNEK
ncbi:MAG: hypothetical protein IT237_04315 [Bacteroidia bacterium]|nr:hypothetical protein [Bacteroidia bacterium]